MRSRFSPLPPSSLVYCVCELNRSHQTKQTKQNKTKQNRPNKKQKPTYIRSLMLSRILHILAPLPMQIDHKQGEELDAMVRDPPDIQRAPVLDSAEVHQRLLVHRALRGAVVAPGHHDPRDAAGLAFHSEGLDSAPLASICHIDQDLAAAAAAGAVFRSHESVDREREHGGTRNECLSSQQGVSMIQRTDGRGEIAPSRGASVTMLLVTGMPVFHTGPSHSWPRPILVHIHLSSAGLGGPACGNRNGPKSVSVFGVELCRRVVSHLLWEDGGVFILYYYGP